MRIIKAGICAGIVLFLWSFFSWMVLPWHNTVLNRWQNEQVVTEAIANNSPISGIYFAPMKYDDKTLESSPKSPMIFVSIVRSGMQSSMWIPAIVSLFTQIVAACLVAWMLFRTSNLGFFSCVSFVTVFGLAAGVVSHIPYMNWFGFDSMYTAVEIADLVIGWYFAGLVLAFFYRRDKNPQR